MHGAGLQQVIWAARPDSVFVQCEMWDLTHSEQVWAFPN